MRRNLAKGRIQPKVSTMPRQQSEAAAFLDIYKLVIEKKRLQQELDSMEQRRQQILTRLEVLNRQVATLEDSAHQMRDQTDTPTAPTTPAIAPRRTRPAAKPSSTPEGETFETFFLDY